MNNKEIKGTLHFPLIYGYLVFKIKSSIKTCKGYKHKKIEFKRTT